MKKKVLHILHAVGGVDVYLRLISENIDTNQFTTLIAHGKTDSERPYIDSKGNEITEFKLTIDREINLVSDFKAVISLVKILKKEKPDVVHAHSAKGGILARTASLFYKINILHTPHAYSYLSTQSNLKKYFFLMLEKTFKHFNSILVATSESERDRGINDVGYKKEKALLFNNSVYPITEIPNLSIDKTWPDNYICTVGRPSYQKNIKLMIDVIAEVKKQQEDIHLVLMGAGLYSPNLESIQDQIKALNLESNVTILGWISRDDIFSIIHNSTFYLTTSRYEGLPYSVIESLALSKAIVATEVDGNKDLVKNNYNGYLIKEENKNEIVDAVLKIIMDDELRANFSANSRNLFNDNFNMQQNIRKLEAIYLNNIR